MIFMLIVDGLSSTLNLKWLYMIDDAIWSASKETVTFIVPTNLSLSYLSGLVNKRHDYLLCQPFIAVVIT